MVNRVGIEPTALGLRVPCSTAELPVRRDARGRSWKRLVNPPGFEPGTRGLKVRRSGL